MINTNSLIEFIKISPTPSLVVQPDAPKFTIIAVNNAYLEATNTHRKDLVGKGILDAFSANKNNPNLEDLQHLMTSMNTVVKTKKHHTMATQKDRTPMPGTAEFEFKYWNAENIPLLNDEDTIEFIIHTIIDNTKSSTASKELTFQNKEKEKRAAELIIANIELTFQNDEKGKRAAELIIANKELAYQNTEKEKRATELIAANIELTFQNKEKEKRAAELIIANKELEFQNEEKEKRADELVIANIEKDNKSEELKIANEKSEYEKNRSDELLAAYKAIEESNERFEYVTKATFDAIWDWNLESDTMYLGEGFNRFKHKNIDCTASILFWKENIHPQDLKRITANYYSIIKSTETNWIEEYRFKKGDGKYSFVINKGILIRDNKNKVIRIIGAIHDLTRIKQEEQQLKLLESVVTNATDAVLITEAEPLDNPGPKIIFVNEAFTKMTGYTAEEVIGKTPRILQGPNSDKEEIKKLSAALRRWESYEVTLLNYKKNGEEFWINMSISPVSDQTGHHTHWIAIERNVTEKIKKEQELAEISQKLFDTIHSIQDGFYTLDANWNISYWNQEAERISGKSQQEVIGKSIWELYDGQISNVIFDKFQKAKKQNKAISIEIFSKKDKKWFEFNAFPSSLGMTTYFKDITERKNTEVKFKKMNRSLEVHVKQLALSNEELEQFAYVASHDLQEPLRMITSFLTQIEKKYENLIDERGKKYIFFAVDGAKRMRQIILDLLEFSRVGKISDPFEEVELNDILEEIVLLYGAQIKEKSATLLYNNLPKILSYSTPIKQIFQNIISNSLKYSKPNVPPVINIKSCHTAHEWKFTIQDNGIGIEAEYFNKIFILFQRLHNKEEYSGTGIGLAITKKIVENLGGQIWVESKVGIGTTFHFTIAKKTKKSYENNSHFISRR